MPTFRAASLIDPIRTRRSRTTGWPMASHMLRTCLVLPSWIAIDNSVWSARAPTPRSSTRTAAGAVRSPWMRMPRRILSRLASVGSPRTRV